MGELETICSAGGVSHGALLWNAEFWKEKLSHIEELISPGLADFETRRAMKSPVVYGNPVMFDPGNWNQAAGIPLRRGKSVEELGDAGWARERERMAHLHHMQQLHQMQLQQQQVGYPGYGCLPPGPPQGPVLVPSPVPPGNMPVHGGMMVPVGGPTSPPVYMQAPWPVQWDNQAHVGQPNVFHQQRPVGHDVYYHPRSEDGHLDLRISEWKGNHCFYQGPKDEYNLQNNMPQERDSNDLRTQDGYGHMEEERGGRNSWDRENEHYSERYDHRRQRDSEEYSYRDRNRDRDNYDRKYKDQYDERGGKYYDTRKHRKHDFGEHDGYNSQHEDYYDRKDKYAHRDHEERRRDHYDSKDRYCSREKDHYRHREEDRYYEEQKSRNSRSDRHAEDRNERRENDYKHRVDYDRRGDERQRNKQRGQYDSEVEERWESKEKDRYYRSRDSEDDRREDRYRRRRDYEIREDDERRPEDYYDHKSEDRYGSREAEHRARDTFKNLRSLSVDPDYEEYPIKDRRTHCEKWVEQQNEKLALGEIQSFEDPIMYCHTEELERGYESNAASIESRKGRKPVYVGSLDRNSFYRKTAPSSLRKSQFATTRRQKQGKHKNVVM